MRSRKCWASTTIVIFSAILLTAPLFGADKLQKFTGTVSDAMCGRKHAEGTPTECTRLCMTRGSRYELIVNGELYVLDTKNPAALATLNKQAGNTATVSGTLDGHTINVRSVSVR